MTSEANDWNAKTIAEFRANDGRVGGNFEGARHSSGGAGIFHYWKPM